MDSFCAWETQPPYDTAYSNTIRTIPSFETGVREIQAMPVDAFTSSNNPIRQHLVAFHPPHGLPLSTLQPMDIEESGCRIAFYLINWFDETRLTALDALFNFHCAFTVWLSMTFNFQNEILPSRTRLKKVLNENFNWIGKKKPFSRLSSDKVKRVGPSSIFVSLSPFSMETWTEDSFTRTNDCGSEGDGILVDTTIPKLSSVPDLEELVSESQKSILDSEDIVSERQMRSFGNDVIVKNVSFPKEQSGILNDDDFDDLMMDGDETLHLVFILTRLHNLCSETVSPLKQKHSYFHRTVAWPFSAYCHHHHRHHQRAHPSSQTSNLTH